MATTTKVKAGEVNSDSRVVEAKKSAAFMARRLADEQAKLEGAQRKLDKRGKWLFGASQEQLDDALKVVEGARTALPLLQIRAEAAAAHAVAVADEVRREQGAAFVQAHLAEQRERLHRLHGALVALLDEAHGLQKFYRGLNQAAAGLPLDEMEQYGLNTGELYQIRLALQRLQQRGASMTALGALLPSPVGNERINPAAFVATA